MKNVVADNWDWVNASAVYFSNVQTMQRTQQISSSYRCQPFKSGSYVHFIDDCCHEKLRDFILCKVVEEWMVNSIFIYFFVCIFDGGNIADIAMILRFILTPLRHPYRDILVIKTIICNGKCKIFKNCKLKICKFTSNHIKFCIRQPFSQIWSVHTEDIQFRKTRNQSYHELYIWWFYGRRDNKRRGGSVFTYIYSYHFLLYFLFQNLCTSISICIKGRPLYVCVGNDMQINWQLSLCGTSKCHLKIKMFEPSARTFKRSKSTRTFCKRTLYVTCDIWWL